MNSTTILQHQQQIIQELGVQPMIELNHELQHRIAFICAYARAARAQALVLGISGGVDSLVVGCLAQRAVKQMRAEGETIHFVAMRLPYGTQVDAADAEACLQVIQPDRCLNVDIQPATDALMHQLEVAGQGFSTVQRRDFILGNIKARQRMIAQYTCAAAENGLVLGSDHAAEAVTGFFTKYGDGAADLMPLTGLNKRQVRALGRYMGAPEHLVEKTPTADLESLNPMQADEASFGVRYTQIDDFLEGKSIEPEAAERIIQLFLGSAHKRHMPAHPPRPLAD